MDFSGVNDPAEIVSALSMTMLKIEYCLFFPFGHMQNGFSP
jgi:hypothetical protein